MQCPNWGSRLGKLLSSQVAEFPLAVKVVSHSLIEKLRCDYHDLSVDQLNKRNVDYTVIQRPVNISSALL